MQQSQRLSFTEFAQCRLWRKNKDTQAKENTLQSWMIVKYTISWLFDGVSPCFVNFFGCHDNNVCLTIYLSVIFLIKLVVVGYDFMGYGVAGAFAIF